MTDNCCSDSSKTTGCCTIEAIISVDERGQMVLPKDLRDKAGIKPGDKLALISWRKEGAVCCIAMVRADNLAVLARDFIQPIISSNK